MSDQSILREARKEIETLFCDLGNGLSGNDFMDAVVEEVIAKAITKARREAERKVVESTI